MGNIINNIRKAFNLVSIQATGLNGNSFSDGKIRKMQEIAEIYTNAKGKNTPLNETNKNNIANKIKELGQQDSINPQLHMSAALNNSPVGTRSAVVMAMFIAFVSTENTKIPANITQLNAALKYFLKIDYDLIQSNSDTQRYLKEASEFINEGYKSVSSYGESQRVDLHKIFFDMGGSIQTSFLMYNQNINYFARTTEDRLLTREDISGISLSVAQDRINKKEKSDTTLNPEEFVLTLHKYPARFGREQADASVIFQKLDTKIKVAITTLIYKHKEYNYLVKKHPQLFNISINHMAVVNNPPILSVNERLQVRKNICKHAIYQHNDFNAIKTAVTSRFQVNNEEKKRRLNIMIKDFNPFADRRKSVADNIANQITAALSDNSSHTLIINNFINYIFNETEEVASGTDALSNSNPSTGASKKSTQSHLTQTNSNFENNNYHSSSNSTVAASDDLFFDTTETSDTDDEVFPKPKNDSPPVIPESLLMSTNSIKNTIDSLNVKSMNPVDDDDEITLISTNEKEKAANNSPTNNSKENNPLEL